MKKAVLLITILSAGLFACESGNENKNTTGTAPPTGNENHAKNTATEIPADVSALLDKYTCLTCHRVDEKLVGPSYKDVALRDYKDEQIVHLIYNPKPENWPGYPPMLPQKEVPREDAMKIAGWINSLK